MLFYALSRLTIASVAWSRWMVPRNTQKCPLESSASMTFQGWFKHDISRHRVRWARVLPGVDQSQQKRMHSYIWYGAAANSEVLRHEEGRDEISKVEETAINAIFIILLRALESVGVENLEQLVSLILNPDVDRKWERQEARICLRRGRIRILSTLWYTPPTTVDQWMWLYPEHINDCELKLPRLMPLLVRLVAKRTLAS